MSQSQSFQNCSHFCPFNRVLDIFVVYSYCCFKTWINVCKTVSRTHLELSQMFFFSASIKWLCYFSHLFWYHVLLYGPDWPATHCIDQAGLAFQVFACLCFQGIVIKHMCQHAQWFLLWKFLSEVLHLLICICWMNVASPI